jgi:hypothetical protein
MRDPEKGRRVLALLAANVQDGKSMREVTSQTSASVSQITELLRAGLMRKSGFGGSAQLFLAERAFDPAVYGVPRLEEMDTPSSARVWTSSLVQLPDGSYRLVLNITPVHASARLDALGDSLLIERGADGEFTVVVPHSLGIKKSTASALTEGGWWALEPKAVCRAQARRPLGRKAGRVQIGSRAFAVQGLT